MKSFLPLILASLFVPVSLFSQDQNISNGLFFDGEPYLAINPNDNQHFVVAWMSPQLFEKVVIRTKTSFDGGSTWTDPQYFNHAEEDFGCADVSLAFDNNGNVYAAYVDYDNVLGSAGAIYVRKSTDGGLNWGEAIEVTSLNDCPDKLCIDRPWIAVDLSGGEYDGAVYVTSMNAKLLPVAPPYNPYFAVSTDGGASFSTPQTLDTEGYLSGNIIPQPMPSPAVGADGKFRALYPSYVISQSLFAQYIMASSDDAGETFSYDIAAQGAGGNNDTLAKLGGLFIADPSDADHLAAFFPLTINDDVDVFMIETTDGGENWTEMTRINDDPIDNGIMQDLVWADFNEQGDLAVCWRDRRNSGTAGYEVPTQIYGAVRWNDSINFTPNFPVSSQVADHDVILNGSGNDFMCVEMVGDTLNAVWGDIRTGVLTIWLNRMDLTDGTIEVHEIFREDQQLLIQPNPIGNEIILDPSYALFNYTVYDLEGRLIFSGFSDTPILPAENLAVGSYILLIEKNGFLSSGQFIKN